MAMRIPHIRVDTLCRGACFQIDHNGRQKVRGGILLVHRNQREHDGILTKRRLRNEANQFEIGRGDLRRVARLDDTNRQRRKAKSRGLKALQKHQRMLPRLLHDNKSPFGFKAR